MLAETAQASGKLPPTVSTAIFGQNLLRSAHVATNETAIKFTAHAFERWVHRVMLDASSSRSFAGRPDDSTCHLAPWDSASSEHILHTRKMHPPLIILSKGASCARWVNALGPDRMVLHLSPSLSMGEIRSRVGRRARFVIQLLVWMCQADRVRLRK